LATYVVAGEEAPTPTVDEEPIAKTLTTLLARTARLSAFNGRRNISPTRRFDRHSGDKVGGADGNTGMTIAGPMANSCAITVTGAHAKTLAIAHGTRRICMKPKPAAFPIDKI
jgi:hypothetical protein